MRNVIAALDIALLVALLVVLLITLFMRSHDNRKYDFDERQKLARGKAYRNALFTLVGYLLITAIFDSMTGVQWSDYFTEVSIGMCLSVDVFTIQCIFSDACVSLKEKPGINIAFFSLMSFISFTNALQGCLNGYGSSQGGKINYNSIGFITAIAFAVNVLAMIVKQILDSRTRAE